MERKYIIVSPVENNIFNLFLGLLHYASKLNTSVISSVNGRHMMAVLYASNAASNISSKTTTRQYPVVIIRPPHHEHVVESSVHVVFKLKFGVE